MDAQASRRLAVIGQHLLSDSDFFLALHPTNDLVEYTPEEVAKHNKEKDCWISVNDQVLNVTEFLPDHPGGKKAILVYAGKDGSEEFNMLHDPSVLTKYGKEYTVGKLKKA